MSAPAGEPGPRLSAVVVSFNTRDDLMRCLDALQAHVRVPFETIVVDNASADGSPDAVRARFPAARLVVNPENVGFARANNVGLRAARAEHVLVVNSDCEVRAGAVEALQLDINPEWMSYDYYKAAGHPRNPTPHALLPTQQGSVYRYYQVYSRDFTVVYSR